MAPHQPLPTPTIQKYKYNYSDKIANGNTLERYQDFCKQRKFIKK